MARGIVGMKLFKWLFGKSEKERLEEYSRKSFEEFRERRLKAQAAASVDGLHYVNHVDKIKQLKRENRNDEAMELLQKCVNATESESEVTGCGVAPWYYEQLAILYRKQKDYVSEVSVLERYQRQIAAPGGGPKKLSERLNKARVLLERSNLRNSQQP